MQYIEVVFTTPKEKEYLVELIPYELGQLGFESFQETEDGLLAYVQRQLFDADALAEAVKALPDGDEIVYSVCDAEYKDWNEEWEREGFEPIVIDDMIIHDCVHPIDVTPYIYNIVIDARLAFGTGTHETTQMMLRNMRSVIETLLDEGVGESEKTLRLLDCGCGTGILSIAASKMGTTEVVGYDIDEWSVENSHHNAQLNSINGCKFFLGDASLLGTEIGGTFDVVVANINRNILMHDVQQFAGMMHKGSYLIVSGFYTEDSEAITASFASQGLIPALPPLENHNWQSLVFTK